MFNVFGVSLLAPTPNPQLHPAHTVRSNDRKSRVSVPQVDCAHLLPWGHCGEHERVVTTHALNKFASHRIQHERSAGPTDFTRPTGKRLVCSWTRRKHRRTVFANYCSRRRAARHESRADTTEQTAKEQLDLEARGGRDRLEGRS